MVTVYSSPTCVYCHMATEYLKGKKVEFKEIDVSRDPEAAGWIHDHFGQLATPAIDIDGIAILGFDREKIDVALRDKKLI